MDSTAALALVRGSQLVHERAADAREWARILATFPLFSDVSRRRLRKLVQSAGFAEFASGETVITRHDADDSLHVVLEGSAKAIGGAAPRSMSIGDYFGELSLIGERSPYAAVVATRPLYVMRLPRRSVARLARQHPALTVTLLRDLAGRITATERTRVIAVPGCSGTGT
jgi:signal-transduction protein with cAMP-binding, CBS, and nucleotidyltransferase domain